MLQNSYESFRWEPAEKKDEIYEEYHMQSYWKNVISLFFHDKLGVTGFVILIMVIVIALIGPVFTTYSYSDMNLDYANIPPRLEIYQVDEENYVYMHRDYYFLSVTLDGRILGRLSEEEDDIINRKKVFRVDGHILVIDYGLQEKSKSSEKTSSQKYRILLDEKEIQPIKKVWNQTYLFGSDTLGRDLFARTLSGAQISLAIAACSTLINSIIGIFYGGIAGYKGGYVDNIMMRIVDVISTIPNTLIVIMLMVFIGPGVKTIIIAMGISNWCTMARIVRGQILSVKEQEFVLSAIAANANHYRILTKHLIPNVSGSIIVCMTMMVPNAIFTESFLSFIGLGVSAPLASWGTLISDGLNSIRTFPYQIIIPSVAICITILSMNFIGRALQNAMNSGEER